MIQEKEQREAAQGPGRAREREPCWSRRGQRSRPQAHVSPPQVQERSVQTSAGTQLPTRLAFIERLKQASVDATVLGPHPSDGAQALQSRPAAAQKRSSFALTCQRVHTQSSAGLLLPPRSLRCGFSACSKARRRSAFCTLKW